MTDAATQTGKEHKHSSSQNLHDQAATAALYVTSAHRQTKSMSKYPLDADNKLSSAGAATSLKHANPRDLPSFPSVGITNPDSSAGAAASLANANHRAFEYWKPELSSSASKAALLAKDYKPAPLWHPELSASGSKAAVLAAKEGGHVNIWRPEASAEGNSAAGQAMRMKNLSPTIDYGYTADGSSRALMAATDAMSGRKRAGSSPVVRGTYPDAANSAANALNAATIANRPSIKGNATRPAVTDLPGLSQKDATRIHDAAITNLGREMYTSNPPVAPEVEEKNRQASLHAAAVSMAKQIYDVQQKTLQSAAGVQRSDSHYAATSVHRRQSSVTSTPADSYETSYPQYANLQEAAQKLAAERLAKLHDDNSTQAAYRNYYGASNPVQSRLSIRGRMRRRASSDGQLPESDEARSQQIRSEMSIFNDKLAQVDAKKRQKDREALLAAAQRNVAQRMHGMDEKVFADTGKVSPAMMSEWEAKAKARAEADSSARMINHGKVDIGGGRFIDQSEIDAIAAARVQPTLDDITRKADEQRAKDEQIRKEIEEQRRINEEKAQAEKDRNLKTKDEWKRFKEEEKREEKAKKDEEKAKKVEEKRLREEEKRKSKAPPTVVIAKNKEEPVTPAVSSVLDPIPALAPITTETTYPAGTTPVENEEESTFAVKIESQPTLAELVAAEVPGTHIEDPVPTATETVSTTLNTETSTLPNHADATTSRSIAPSAPADQGQHKVSSWLKTKFARRSSKAVHPSDAPSSSSKPTSSHPITTADISSPIAAAPLPPSTAGSDAAVAMVGAPPITSTYLHSTATQRSHSRSTSISSLSSDGPTTSAAPRGRSMEPRPVPAHEVSEDTSGSRDDEEFEEARDTFDAEKLPVPSFPKEGLAGENRGRGSPVRDSRFVEDL